MITFAHPTIAAPTVSVVLGDVEQKPTARPRRKLQSAFETDGGNQIIYSWGDEVRVWTMRLYPLTKSERDAMDAFWNNVSPNGVDGRVESFQILDSYGDTYTVRFAMDVLSAPHVDGFYEISATVRVI